MRLNFLLKIGVIIFILLFSLGIFADDATPAKRNDFLIVTDIHFDPYIACYQTQQTPCPLLVELMHSGVDQWNSIFKKYAQKEHIIRGKDTSFDLLRSTLARLKKTRPKFVIVLGDFLAHKYYQQYLHFSGDPKGEHYREFVYKTMSYLAKQLRNTFPENIPLYAVIGNDDAYRSPYCKTADYCIIPNGKFYHDVSNLWSKLFIDNKNRKKFMETFPKLGYYEIHPAAIPNLRMLIMNSIVFSELAQGKDIQNASLQQLQWLQKQLAKAQLEKQKVLLVMHIPPGVDVYATLKNPNRSVILTWKSEYTNKFLALLKKYSDSVIAILTSHFHMDGFILIDEKDHHTIPDVFTPAISPIDKNNPSYKTFYFDPKTLKLKDYITFYLRINSSGDQKIYLWKKEYDFKKVYQPDCQHCNLVSGMERLHSEGELASKYIQFYAVDTESQPIEQGYWFPYYWCAIHNLTKFADLKCTHQ